MKKFVFLFLLVTSPAWAADKKSVAWEPKSCEFQMAFPEAPFLEKKCPDGADKPCHNVVTFTHVVNVKSRVTVRASCQTRTEDEIKKLNDESLKQIARDMSQTAGLEPQSVEVRKMDNNVRTATVLSLGARNDVDVIYTGQVWVGKNSILRLDAEMSGPQNKVIDEQFSTILKSLKAK